MAELAWTTPVVRKDTGNHRMSLAGPMSDLCATRIGGSISMQGAHENQRRGSSHSYQSLGRDSKGNYQKPPMSAIKGAWQKNGSRPQSPHGSNVDDDHGAAVALLHSMQAKPKRSAPFQEDISSHMLGHGGHRSRHAPHVDSAGSVNKDLERKISQLRGSVHQERNSRQAKGTDAEFVAISGPSLSRKSIGRDSRSGSYNQSKGDHSKGGNFKTHPHEDDDHEYVIEDLEKDDEGNFTGNTYAEGSDNDGGLPMIVVDDGEGKNGNRGMGGKNGMSGHDNSGMSRQKTAEDLIEDRKRKLWQKMKKLNTFRSLFDKTKEESMYADNEFDNCNDTKNFARVKKGESIYPQPDASPRTLNDSQKQSKLTNVQGDGQNLNDSQRQTKLTNVQGDSPTLNDSQKQSKVPSHTNTQTTGQNLTDLPGKSVINVVTSHTNLQNAGSILNASLRRSKVPSFTNIHDTGQFMMSPESIKVMKDTLDQKKQHLFGEQPWLLGRLALSKDTCRFEIPMDVYVLTRISPMDYLSKYAIISRRRKSLYRSVFVKTDKDRDGWISYRDLVKALKDIHVNNIDENEIEDLTRMLDLSDTPEQKFNSTMFSGIAAFSERLVLNTKQHSQKCAPFTKEKLEDSDFDNFKWKLKGVNVNPGLLRVLEVL